MKNVQRVPVSSHASPPQRGGSLCSARRCQEPSQSLGSLTNHAASPAQGSATGLPSHFSRNQGQVMLLACLLFLAGATAIAAAVAAPALRAGAAARAFADSRQGLFAGSSAAEDIAYRNIKGIAVDGTETVAVGGDSADATAVPDPGGLSITSSANGALFVRKSTLQLVYGGGAAFHYGVQSGAGGMILENSSSVSGNVYSNGPVSGAGGNVIRGDAVSAGAGGLIEGVHATSSAYAHTIRDSTIDGDASYTLLTNTTVGGALHPGSADPSPAPLPINDGQIAGWEADAAAGGTISSPCPYKITDTATLGPKKINCDLEISGNGYILTLAGPVWVAGKITITNSPTIKVAPALGPHSVMLIADKISDRTNASTISVSNSALFSDSGIAGSYVVLIAQNTRAENGGNGDGNEAVTVANSVNGKVLVYAGHGEILMQNSVSLKEVTGYRIRLKNSAEVQYETGLANLLFTAGPSGGYTIGGWKEAE